MDSDNEIKLTNFIIFAPDMWGEVLKFNNFAHPTYDFQPHTFSELEGVDGHFNKYKILQDIANEMLAKLSEDDEQLEKYGYSNSIRSKQLTVIVETIFCEFYSSLDCTRQVINKIYGKYRGANSKKTSRLFRYASEDKIDERVPIEIRSSLAEAYDDWFLRLRDIRTAIVHSDVGSCYKDVDGKINYFHGKLGMGKNNSFAIDDVFQEISTYADRIDNLLRQIFHALNNTLDDVEVDRICGLFGGLGYQRTISSYEAKDFNSGKCKSYLSFEKGTMPRCPFADKCGAYKRVIGQKNSTKDA